MSEQVLVSVCLPLYKPDSRYLIDLADGLRKQCYQNFEVIISDDGNDATLISEVFTGINFRYIRNSGEKGIFFNLNNAILNASGEYIQILCQDDVMKAEMLEKQLNTLRLFPSCAFVYTQSTKIDKDGRILYESKDTGIGEIRQEDLSNYLLVYGCLPGNLSTVMVKKEMLLELNLFDTSQLYASDFNMWIRAAQKYGMAINYDELLFLRSHSDQASFSLPNRLSLLDMNTNLKLLYRQSSFTPLKKYFYLNSLYGKTILVKSIREFIKKKSASSLFSMFKVKYPLSLLMIFPLSALYYLGVRIKFNFGKYSVFPKPINSDLR